MKKLLLTLGATASVVAPMATVVACGDKAEANNPGGSENQGVWDDFNIDYTVDEKTTVFTSTNTGSEFEINITGFDENELTVLTGVEVTLGSFHLMNQIIDIVKDNMDKDITGITVNGIRIDDAITDTDGNYFGMTFAEMIDIPTRFYEGVSYFGLFNNVIGNARGGDAVKSFTNATLTFLDAFWGDFKSALAIEDIVVEGRMDMSAYGGEVNGSKLTINGDYLGLSKDPTDGFADIYEASLHLSMGGILSNIFSDLDATQLSTVTEVEVMVEGTSLILELDSAMLNDFVNGSENEDFLEVINIDPTSTEFDSYFDAFSEFELTDDEYTVAEWRAGGHASAPSFGYWEKEAMFLHTMLMIVHA